VSSVDLNDIPQILGRGVDLTARREYGAALPIFAAVYQAVPPEKFPQGLSAYGLCLSQVQHKNKMGADLCEKAIALEPFEGLHWANLVRLYAGVKNRRKAVEVLETGLKKHPRDSKLLRVRDEIGYRKSASLSFLPRTNPLNKFYSRAAVGAGGNGKTILIVIAGGIVAAIVACVVWLLMQ